MPARSLRDLATLSTSGPAPTAFRRERAAEVLAMAAESNASEAMTRGTSGTEEIWWPRARSRAGTEEAASAEVVAKRLGVKFVNYTR